MEINSERGHSIGCNVYKLNSDYTYGYSIGMITQNTIFSNMNNAVYGVSCYCLEPQAVDFIAIVIRLY